MAHGDAIKPDEIERFDPERLVWLIQEVYPCHCSHPQDHHCWHYTREETDTPLRCCHCQAERAMLDDDPDMSLADWEWATRIDRTEQKNP